MPEKIKIKKPRKDYSVLIADKNTLNSLKRHLPFFQQAVDEGKLGIIQWHPEAESFETAFPGLLELVEDKRHWNALFIHLPWLQTSELARPSQANPFDLCQEWFEESDEQYPMIRAAHMLAGFPGTGFTLSENEQNKSGVDFKKEEEREEAFEALKEQYLFDGIRPETVYFITGRINFDARKAKIQKSFARPKEKADFYTRNAYPPEIRFLLYDFTTQGELKREAESLEFWLFIHTLALNKDLSSQFKSNQLYRFKTVLNIDKLEEFLQEKSNQLRASREYLIKESRSQNLSSKDDPELVQQIAIQSDLPDDPGFNIPNDWLLQPVPFLSNSIQEDLHNWQTDMDQAEKNFSFYEHALDEAKEQKVEMSHDSARVFDGEAKALSKRQKNLILEQKERAQNEIYQIKNNLARDLRSINKKIAQKNEEIQNLLRHQRITGSGAINLCLFILAASIVCLISAFFFVPEERVPVGFSVASLLFYEMLGVFTLVLVYLLFQRVRLKMAVNGMNELLDMKAMAIHAYNEHLGEYLSSLATYTKCANYLRAADKVEAQASDFTAANENIHKIDHFLSDLIYWARANHLHLDLSDTEPVIYYLNDKLLMTQISAYTSFDSHHKTKSEINETGILVESSYPFIEGLQIEQEDLHAA